MPKPTQRRFAAEARSLKRLPEPNLHPSRERQRHQAAQGPRLLKFQSPKLGRRVQARALAHPGAGRLLFHAPARLPQEHQGLEEQGAASASRLPAPSQW